jgi:hypothetical protein
MRIFGLGMALGGVATGVGTPVGVMGASLMVLGFGVSHAL